MTFLSITCHCLANLLLGIFYRFHSIVEYIWLMIGPRSGAETERSYPVYEVRGGSREELLQVQGQGWWQEEQPHVQGAVAVRAQEGQEELIHVQGQEGQR